MKNRNADEKYKKLLKRRNEIMRMIENKKLDIELNKSRYYGQH